ACDVACGDCRGAQSAAGAGFGMRRLAMNRTSKPRTIMAALAGPQQRIQPVLSRAAQLAEAFDAELLLFHAAFESALSGRLHFDSKQLARARGWRLDQHRRALDRHARKLRGRG